MSDVVIRAEGLGKRYLIGHETERESYVALRDVIARSARKLARSASDMVRGRQLLAGDEIEEFWALKDVDFEVKRGEVVGIIGRNGAGKSTLLKVLSRITEPTTGRVEIRGRVASLLEVGTGFHPELTGRENIFLNGAILGMSRAEIKRKFEEIVAFAEVERFLDTPVKRYSSGMYVRLAFAVAAHLEPEILIVDEVLAVGDAEFQKKCLGKMKDVAGHGRTVLFVSHNMGAVSKLCATCMLLQAGKVHFRGRVSEALELYKSSSGPGVNQWCGPWSGPARYFSPAELRQLDGRRIVLSGVLEAAPRNFIIALRVLNAAGDEVLWTTHKDIAIEDYDTGNKEFLVELPAELAQGQYEVELVTFLHGQEYIIRPDAGPRIVFVKEQNANGSSFFDVRRPGIIQPLIPWQNISKSVPLHANVRIISA